MAASSTLFWLVIIIIIVIAAVVAVVYVILNPNTSNIIPFGPPPCNQNPGALIDITNDGCCFFNNSTSDLKYNLNLDMILAPFPSFYLDVCIGFCPTGSFNSVTQTCQTSDPVALNKFNNCVALLQPQSCQGVANPVARSGATLYYAFEATQRDCQSCCLCGLTLCQPEPCF